MNWQNSSTRDSTDRCCGRRSSASFPKLNPATLWRNPVMFVVEVGAALITLFIIRDLAIGQTASLALNAQIAAWLWITVLFANFAEAVAEGRGKAQADALRRTRVVDLDSNPTKLMDVVEIGKQLLITRGSLTTFSIANDVAKYFAIIPAMFVVAYPVLNS